MWSSFWKNSSSSVARAWQRSRNDFIVYPHIFIFGSIGGFNGCFYGVKVYDEMHSSYRFEPRFICAFSSCIGGCIAGSIAGAISGYVYPLTYMSLLAIHLNKFRNYTD